MQSWDHSHEHWCFSTFLFLCFTNSKSTKFLYLCLGNEVVSLNLWSWPKSQGLKIIVANREKSKCCSAGLMGGKQLQVHAGVSPGVFQIKWTGIVSFYWLHYPFDVKQHIVTQFCKQSACIHIDRACEICGNYLLKSRRKQNSPLFTSSNDEICTKIKMIKSCV